MQCTVVYTDLDGTLLDHDTYRFDEAQDALSRLRQAEIPVVFCSSKTRAEIEVIRREMGNDDPFICENGGAVFIPGETVALETSDLEEREGYRVIELGEPYGVLVNRFRALRDGEGFKMSGFSDWTAEEIAGKTGLSIEAARLAGRREYSEPFEFYEDTWRYEALETQIREEGLQITRGGRFHHLIGNNDKGEAVQHLTDRYAAGLPGKEVVTIGLGDGANDVPMLRRMDVPVVIRKKTGLWETVEGRKDTYFSKASGPGGWAEAIDRFCFG